MKKKKPKALEEQQLPKIKDPKVLVNREAGEGDSYAPEQPPVQ